MIYGKSNVFDVERLIDLLQAFELFADVRDDKAGLMKTNPKNVGNKRGEQTREALKFLFSKEGEFFRAFLLDEVVRGADCLGRDAARVLASNLGLRGANIPGVFKAVAPKLTSEDKKVVENTRKLLSFFLGDSLNSLQVLNRRTPYNPSSGLFGLRLNVPNAFNSINAGTNSATQIQAEMGPILRELGPEMRTFGLEIVGRLTEKLASRVLRYASNRVLGNYYGSAKVEGEGARELLSASRKVDSKFYK